MAAILHQLTIPLSILIKIIGLIDFGSNTFHLLIAKMAPEKLEIIHQQRKYVYLAQTGITTIAQEAISRGIKALEEFMSICTRYKVDEIVAVGTAALRTAENSRDFISTINHRFGIRTQIIDGHREADLIYKGMILACPHHKKRALFVDIGGGSTEFILTDDAGKVYQNSFPIGLGVLKNKIPFSDPILPSEIKEMNLFLTLETGDLIEQLRRNPPSILIGGSGTFDVLAEALTPVSFHSSDCSTTDPALLKQFISDKLYLTLSDRRLDNSIPEERIHLIVHAFQLILWVLEVHTFQSVAFSKFALKEGLLHEYYEAWLENQST